ncbi:unnamed protein product, partial [Ectocarpus sp. 8 AP-2014]
GEGDDGEEGDEEGCVHLVASVCTHLLCPAYPEVDEPSRASGGHSRRLEGAKTRGMLVEGDAYETPPPKPFVSRHQRGFLEYDRRQPMSRDRRLELREEIREMFIHSYDGYMRHAFPGGELLPLSCGSGELHLVKVPLVTLVDSLDALAIMG